MKRILTIFFAVAAGIWFLSGSYAKEVRGMKVLMVIASSNFRDEELFEPKKVLEDGGAEVVIASSSLSTSCGVLGGTAKPDILLRDVKAADYDGVVFVGGGGSMEYWDDPVAHGIIRDAASLNKVLGAICIAPVTLANAGVLKGKRATVWGSEGERLTIRGAAYTMRSVEADGRIVTANGPAAAKEFGRTILELLE